MMNDTRTPGIIYDRPLSTNVEALAGKGTYASELESGQIATPMPKAQRACSAIITSRPPPTNAGVMKNPMDTA